jgi:enoyl-CoA hydratase/carnithine racemase
MMVVREDRGAIAVLRMAHGRANALDPEVLRALSGALEAAADAPALVLTGTGAMFSAGVDLKRLAASGPDYPGELIPALVDCFARFFYHPRPVVAAVNGHAIAGGCVLACCADRRLMARDAGRIGITELLVGLPFPALAFEVMRFVAAPQHFPALVYSGATFPPDEAHGLGLVDEVVAPAALLDRAVADARTLALLSPQAFTVTKRQLRLDITERMKKHGRRIDAEASKIWASTKATETIRDYVARTLRK